MVTLLPGAINVSGRVLLRAGVWEETKADTRDAEFSQAGVPYV